MTESKTPSFFLGANSSAGFFPYFDQAYQPEDGWRLFILKGGPGTGKSTLMKRFAQRAQETGETPETIYCSSDPASLDAVLLPERKVGIVDGTPPHVMEPKYPGVSETLVNLGDCWDSKRLASHRGEIVELSKQCAAEHNRSGRYLHAAGTLLEDTYQYALRCTDTEKLKKYADKTARRIDLSAAENGRESIRFLSGITPDGIVFFDGTPACYGTRCFCVEDEYGPVAHLFLQTVRQRLLEQNAAFISCYDPLFPATRLEALIIPGAGLTFLARSSRLPMTQRPFKTIHAKRFMDAERLAQRKQRMTFTKKAARELVREGVRCLQNAKTIHDGLEQLYTQAMDFDKAEAMTQALLASIFA